MYVHIFIYIYALCVYNYTDSFNISCLPSPPRQRVPAPDGSPHRRLLHVLHLLAGRVDDGHGLAGTQLGRGLEGKIISGPYPLVIFHGKSIGQP